MTNAAEIVPTICIICWRYGVAPTIWPAFKSCILSPAMAPAQQTTLPTMIAAAGPLTAPLPISSTNSKAETTTVAIVNPESGLLDEPTRPAMYAATPEKIKPVMTIVTAIVKETAISCTKN